MECGFEGIMFCKFSNTVRGLLTYNEVANAKEDEYILLWWTKNWLLIGNSLNLKELLLNDEAGIGWLNCLRFWERKEFLPKRRRLISSLLGKKFEDSRSLVIGLIRFLWISYRLILGKMKLDFLSLFSHIFSEVIFPLLAFSPEIMLGCLLLNLFF